MKQQLTGYELGEKLHESSRGIVFRARDPIGKPVIVKLPAGRFPNSEDIKRVRREFQLGSLFRSDYIIRYLALESMGHGNALVTEDFGGDSLVHVIPNEGLPLVEFIDIALKLALGLSEIHREEIAHKDINGHNVVYNRKSGTIKFIDFGIASKLNQEYQQAISPHALEGHLGYISPEQTGRMNRPIDYRTDFYSLGITLYEAITGRLPFVSKDPLELIHCHLAREAVPVHQIREDVPVVIGQIIAKLMAKEAAGRYQSGQGLSADLLRCYNQLKAGLTPGIFALGQEDHSSDFHLSGKLYGRSRELGTLLETFDRVSAGSREFLLVSGYSGIGKSALVNEIHKPVTARKGIFASGKFEQLSGNVVYSALSTAFRGMISRILSEDERIIRQWSKVLKNALGENGAVITELIPEVELITGPWKPLSRLAPIEAKNRFQMVFRDFVACFANRDHPLVLFLDDLQWADSASLAVLELLLSDKKIEYFMLLGAYRSNEVHASHILDIQLNELRKKGIEVLSINLGPLQASHLADMLADTLHTDSEEVAALARIVAEKAKGNPFYCYELLKDLYRRGFLFFDRKEGRWVWDEEQIKQQVVSENVVDFMIERLQELPSETLDVLKIASTIGNTFDLKTLAAVARESPNAVAKNLWQALKDGIVIPMSGNYRIVGIEMGDSQGEPSDLGITYRFLHDRVQQAAYVLLPEQDRDDIHIAVARALMRDMTHQQRKDLAVEVMSHVQGGASLIEDESEKATVAELGLFAAQKALASSAPKQALDYLDTTITLLSEKYMFNRHYDLAYQVYRVGAEAAYLSGNPDLAERYCTTLLDNIHTTVGRARILQLQMEHYTTLRRMSAAMDCGIRGLYELNVMIPRKVSLLRVLREFASVNRIQGMRKPAQLLELPRVENETVITIHDLLRYLALPVYYSGDRLLYAYITLKRIRFSLTFGNCPGTANAYVTYGLLLGSLGQYKRGYAFGKLALALDGRYGLPALRTRVLFVYGCCILPWNEHWSEITPYLKRAIDAGSQSGDLIFLSLACSLIHHFNPSIDLETSLTESEKYLVFLERVHYQGLEIQAKIFRQLRRCLMGLTRDRLSLEDDDFSEEKCLAHVQGTDSTSFLGLFYILKLELAYTFGAYEAALELLPLARATLSALIGFPIVVEYHFYAYLTYAALMGRAGEGKRGFYRLKMQPHLRKMKKWARHCPVNFKHRYLLMKAERERLSGNCWKALDFYRDAARQALDNQYLKHVALAHELAGTFLLAQGQRDAAGTFLREAEQHYHHWGARAKVKQLREQYAEILELSAYEVDQANRVRKSTELTSVSISASHDQARDLDLNTVIKSSMTISSEIHYKRLQQKMMKIVIESAGAQMGAFIANEERGLVVEAVTHLGGEGLVGMSQSLDNYANLSQKIIRYCARTSKTVVLGNASEKDIFAKDPYLTERGVKSVLCTPISQNDRMVGLLYLENNLVEDAFTEDRVELLQLLIAQAAISMENARLYAESKRDEAEVRKLNQDLEQLNEELEKRVLERTAELNRAQEELVEKAHQAGMAEVASSVLHNVGNILNSVITSCQLIHGTVTTSKMDGLIKANNLLRQNMDDIENFIEHDPKGKNLLRYYLQFDKPLLRERDLVSENAARLLEKIASIRDVIMAQQSYASRGFQEEPQSIAKLVDDALNILGSSVSRRGIEIFRGIEHMPPLMLPKNKIIHLLVNIIKNAIEAMEHTAGERRLSFGANQDDDWLCLSISDTGYGIEESNQRNLFKHGFTTKDKGHGFGLHSCAAAMSELGGKIDVESEGKDKGATFTLYFPHARIVETQTSSV